MAEENKNKRKEKEDKDFIEVEFPEGKKSLQILFTFKSEDFNKNYVFTLDTKQNEYYVFEIIDDQKLKPVQDEKEMDFLDEILTDFLKEHPEKSSCEGGCSCGCEHDHCSCEHDDEECCCEDEDCDCDCEHDNHDCCCHKK